MSNLIELLKEKISINDIGFDYGCGYAPALADFLKKDGFNVEVYDPFFLKMKISFLENLILLLVQKLLNISLNLMKSLTKLIVC